MSLRQVASGKVRDIYEIDPEHLLIVASDRISAFDVVMAEPILDRGRVLTALTEFWLCDVAPHLPSHFVSTEIPDGSQIPDAVGRSMVVRRADMIPIEFIVRGHLAGSGWAEYQRAGTLHGQPLPSGLSLGSKLPQPVLTPSTKGDLGEHDINLTRQEAVDRIGADLLGQCEALALEMFELGREYAASRGFILADTKFELGFIDGTLSLCDEILTPDSSRYWPAEGWSLGEVPPSYDKQDLRDWLEVQPWDKTPPPPAVPTELIAAVRSRYVELYEQVTGRSFAEWPGVRCG